jgi:twitching motility protein PilU
MDLLPYLKMMVEKNGSDLFFSVGARPNIKVEGKTIPIGSEPVDAETTKRLAYSIMSQNEIKAFESDLELNIGFSRDGIGRFRANIYQSRDEVSMVIRYIKDIIPDMKTLGLPDILKKLILEKRGLILVVGATGTGKTTTLASMIDYRNTHESGHILTIEDPIEFIHKHKKSVVDQREIGTDTRSYDAALMNALREAPDVIAIGEVRDEHVMRRAIQYAETGHLCITTLHASNASQTLERILNFFPGEERQRVLQDLGLFLKAVISQRLLYTKGGKRAAVVEVMMNSAHIADLIEQGKINDIKEVMVRQAKDGIEGVSTFDDSILALWRDGRISASEAVRNADSQHNVHMTIEFEKPGSLDDVADTDLTLGG